MNTYKHTQIGWLVIWLMASVIALTVLIMLFDEVAWVGVTAAAILAVCAVLFCTLTVEVNQEAVRLRFGPGPIGKRFAMADIRNARAVKNRWYYGWGIRLSPHGWLFNVSGFDAVELDMANGKKYRVGTDDPEKLLAAIQQWRGM